MDYCEIFSASSTLADLYVYYERTGEVSGRSALWLMHSSMFLEKICCARCGMDGMLEELIQLKNEASEKINWEASKDITKTFREASVITPLRLILFCDVCAL